MNIKKVDDKPMVIHTKEKAKLHMHEPKNSSIKGANVYTLERGSKLVNETAKKSFRSSTVHQSGGVKESLIKSAMAKSQASIKTKTNSIKVAGAAGATTALSNMEGGDEIRDAANIAYVASRPARGVASKTAELGKRHAIEQAKKRIKKANQAKKIGKKNARDTAKRAAKQTAKTTAKTAAKETTKETTKIVAKETGKVVAKVGTDAAVAAVGTVASCETGPAAPLIGAAAGIVIGGAVGEAVGTQMDIADAKMNSRNRKIRFFLDKMKEEDKQQDSVLPIERAKTFSNRSYIFICNSIYTIGKYYIIKNDWGTCN